MLTNLLKFSRCKNPNFKTTAPILRIFKAESCIIGVKFIKRRYR
ncbi:hypothetical protein CAMRE0001_2960 [Campylobacter rectus RM3267]|uniref:Uncharacterized protein n=1 Tax=Campylobacter rectus RM3267 TaxID=553218 RepID=B9D613_CAMRE|nr:hypothetical protein CAMRE0001_2960 [Campylobacter rectus RM3267]